MEQRGAESPELFPNSGGMFSDGLPTGVWDHEKIAEDNGRGWINAMSCWAAGMEGSEAMLVKYLSDPPPPRQFTNPRPATATIYFIGSEAGPIKIGYAKDVSRRMRDLQNTGPSKLTLLATLEGELKIEREYHKRFAEHRLHGEWFEPHQDILAEIERLSGDHMKGINDE